MSALICDGEETPDRVPCPKNPELEHTPEPAGYPAWFEWAARMGNARKTQKKCPGCGLYKVWVP